MIPSAILVRLLLILLTFFSVTSQAQNRPNILILIADDMGVDAFEAFQIGADLPQTPHLNRMLSEGVLFTNAWAYPTCAPTRASILTGRYGNKTSLTRSGPNLPREEISLFEQVDTITNNAYSNALFGKWHLGNANSPNIQGISHYMGNIYSGVSDYYKWERTTNGVKDTSTTYVTSHVTDEAIDWVDNQNQPWLLWMAYNAPHAPNHLPPDSLYTRTQTSSNFDEYLCMIESVDHEIGRLYNSLSQAEKDSTIIIFLGDNGTPNASLQAYPRQHGKTTIYEGGIRVPMFISGYGVDRKGEREDGLVAAVDIYATVMELLGTDLPGGYHNSYSLLDVLVDSNAVTRPYNYSEIQDGTLGFLRAIRNEQYKLIIMEDSTNVNMEFYDLLADPQEFTELLAGGLTPAQTLVMDDLKAEADSILNSWSCRDLIQNGDEEGIDCGGSSCTPCQMTNLADKYIIKDLSLYPNPANEFVVIDLMPGTYNLRMIDSFGRLVLIKEVTGDSQLDVNSLSPGLYFVEVKDTRTNEMHLAKMVKY